ncbi:MAG TPA: PqqD family protein [Ktedonobacterales bacterium]|nr:PqqD family protein [Ktedonobacterales bacterium]
MDLADRARSMPDGPKTRNGVETYIVPDGTCFLYDPANDASYTLDQMGALVWDYCDGQTSTASIVQEIAALLPDDTEIPDRVTRLLAEFADEGLLEPASLASVSGADDD